MKKLVYLSVVVFGMFLVFPTHSQAQNEFKVGGGLVYGSGIFDGSGVGDWQNDIGITLDGFYIVNEQIRVGPGITYFFPKDESGLTSNVWELALNGNYIFYTEDEFDVYGIAGLAFTNVSTDPDGASSTSETVLGVDLGAGIEYGVDFGDLFGELKIANIGGSGDDFDLNSQLVLAVGARFAL